MKGEMLPFHIKVTKKALEEMTMFEKVAEILADYKDIDVSAITMDSTFADLGVDSLDTAELIMNLEDEFNITIEMNEKLSTVGELVALIEENVK